MKNMTSAWATGTYELLMQNTGDDQLMLTVFALAVDTDTEDWDSPVLAQVEIDRDERAPLMKPLTVGEAGIAPEALEFTLGPRLALRALMVLHEAALQDARGLDAQDAPWRAPNMKVLDMAERFNDAGLLLATRLFSM